MKEAAVRGKQPVITHPEPTEVAEPPDRALHDPAPAIAAQTPPLLIGGLGIVRTRGDDRGVDGDIVWMACDCAPFVLLIIR
jgi:hypothetical protein